MNKKRTWQDVWNEDCEWTEAVGGPLDGETFYALKEPGTTLTVPSMRFGYVYYLRDADGVLRHSHTVSYPGF